MSNKLSRAQVETLLMLDAIGDVCPHGALAARLGLCPSLAAAIDQAARKLGALVVESEDGFKLGAAGRRFLESFGLSASEARTRCA